jgi:thioredoxin 1
MIDTSKPIHLNYPSFDQVVGNSLVLVDFWAEWCGPCKAQDPVLEELAADLNGRVIIGKVNVDDNRTLASRYGIMSIPTMILFRKGEKLHHFTGVTSKERILSILKKYI